MKQFFSWAMMLTFFLLMGAGTSMALTGNDTQNQPVEQCATPAPNSDWEADFQKMILKTRQQLALQGGNATYTIPIIVHIIHTGQAVGSGANIAASRVTSQLETLNRDFSGTGTNVQNVPAIFSNLVANTGIQFCLATRDPQGNLLAEPGIERIRASDRGWTNPGIAGYATSYIDGTIKPQSYWDPSLYLNVWVCQLSAGLLGYATFPNFSTLSGIPAFWQGPETDGVVITTGSFGTTGSSLGRTTTHEIGHWLGLRHIWGDTNCGDDFCNDTPVHNAANQGCPAAGHKSTCAGTPVEMTMNFMDYSSDNCTYMFSLGQKERMITTMMNSPLRIKLANSPMCSSAPLAPVAKIQPEVPSVCPGGSLKFLDKSLFLPTAWEWTFPGGTPATSTEKNPTVTFPTGGTYPVTLKASNANGSSTTTINFTVIPTLSIPYSQNFEGIGTNFPPDGWTVVTRNDLNIGWSPFTGASGFGIGNNCIYFDNTNLDVTGFEDDIRTPMFDFTSAQQPALIYDFAHSPYTEFNLYDDEFQVLGSTNCGSSFTSLFRKKGSEIQTFEPTGEDWVPGANGWRTDTIRLTQYAGQARVMLNIRNIAKYGHSFYVDNVRVRDLAAGAPPEITEISASTTNVCPGSSVTFTAQAFGAPNQYSWTLPGSSQPAAVTTTNTITVTYQTPGSYNVSVTASSGFGSGSLQRNNLITVLDQPVISVNDGNVSACAGGSATLTATGGRSYVWSTGATTSSITVSPSVTTQYTVIGTALNGCKDTAVATVTVSTTGAPIVTVNSESACVGATITLTAGGATTYSWSTGQSGASISYVVTGNANVTVTGTKDGCNGQAVATITALPTPAKPTITRNGNILTSSSATNNQWYKDGVLIPGANGQTLEITETGTYQVFVTDASSDCSIASNELVITSTAIKDQLKNISLRLFPNPNQGSFNVEMESYVSGTYVMTLTNIAGQELNAQTVNITAGRVIIPIDVKNLADGMYFFRMTGSEGQTVLPVVIQR